MSNCDAAPISSSTGETQEDSVSSSTGEGNTSSSTGVYEDTVPSSSYPFSLTGDALYGVLAGGFVAISMTVGFVVWRWKRASRVAKGVYSKMGASKQANLKARLKNKHFSMKEVVYVK